MFSRLRIWRFRINCCHSTRLIFPGTARPLTIN